MDEEDLLRGNVSVSSSSDDICATDSIVVRGDIARIGGEQAEASHAGGGGDCSVALVLALAALTTLLLVALVAASVLLAR